MKRRTVFCTLSISLVFFSLSGQSQDTALTNSQKNTGDVIQHYNAAMKENLYIYNGAAYTGSYRKGNGHAYYFSETPLKGSIVFEGIRYLDISMQYDLILGELVVNDYTKNFSIKPDPGKISSFVIAGHKFVHLTAAEGRNDFPGAGYFEELFKGAKSSVYAIYKKQAVEPSRPDDPLRYFEYISYYILKDGRFFSVASQNAVIKVYRDKEKNVRDFLQSADLNYKKDNQGTLIRVAAYYEQLN